MKVIKNLFLLIVYVISINHSFGQALENSIFWKISGNGLEKPSYIFGTHHLHDYTFIKNNEGIHQMLKEVDIVVGEVEIDNQDLSIVTKMFGAMMMKDQTISSLLSPEQFKIVDAALKKHAGLGLRMFNQFKPIFVYQVIMVSKYAKTQDNGAAFNPNMMESPLGSSMDGYFQQVGQEEGKEIKGLETIDQQLSILVDGYSLDRQVEMLLEIAQDQESDDADKLLELTKLYQEQNIEALYTSIKETSSDDELRTLVIDRNVQWIPQLEEMFKNKKSVFVAVGAGHLPGDFGVLKLLAQKGYTITPVSIIVE